MKKSNQKNFITMITTTLLTTALLVDTPIVTMAGQPNTGINGGQFTDFNTLTWTTNDGTDIAYGRGPVFSDVHPEITDPEYYVKEAMQYPGEERVTYNSQGKPKANYSDASVEEVRKFINSFDWIHSDELTRAAKVYDRISKGVYADPENIIGFPLLVAGKGQCREFSGEFKRLANYIGLECETYEPFYMHQACLVKISGQWFATDPTGGDAELPFLSNAITYPVDYEIEKNRYAKESDAKREEFYAENPDSIVTIIALTNKKTTEGLITEDDWARINPTEAELDRMLSANEISYEEYERQMIELLKSMW